MPDIEISKVKTRRGTNDQRSTIIFDQGEIVSTTDTKRVYLGTGVLSGGIVVGNKTHQPVTNFYSLSNTIAEVGDLVNANNIFYQLTGSDYTNISNWVNVGTKVNSLYFDYGNDNTLTLKVSSIPSNFLIPNTISNGLKLESNLLQLDYHPAFFTLSSNKITPIVESLTELQINPTSFFNGISGGGYNKIGLSVDPAYFYFDGGMLSLSATPAQAPVTFINLSSVWFGAGLIYDFGGEEIRTVLTDVDDITITKTLTGGISIKPDLIGEGLVLNGDTLSANLVSVDNSTLFRTSSGSIYLNPSIFGSGLVYNTTTPILSTTLTGVDNISLTATNSGIVSIKRDALSGVNNWPQITVDPYGRVVTHESSILDVLTGNASMSSLNSLNSLSAIYNGDSLGLSGLEITQFTALSSDGITTITLSSAGFITFEGNTTTRNGSSVGRFAIPIYRY